MAELKRRKLGGRRFLRDMPWYVIIGPPASGKTTALRQSGLEFPFDLTDDLQGVGGTRNCDWFFTETAVLIDTAGRYVQQESQPEVDAAEWLGFLDLLKKHRGRRALNGVIVALSAEILAEGDASIRAHGREIRKRLAELNPASRSACRSISSSPSATSSRASSRPSRASPPPSASRSGARPSPPARRRTAARSARELAALVRAPRGPRRPAHGGRGGAGHARRDFPLPGPGREPRGAAQAPRRHRLRREPLRGERLAARLLPHLGHPGRHADRPAGRHALLGLRPAGRPCPRRAAGGAAQLLPPPLPDRRGLRRGRPRLARPQGRAAPPLALARRRSRRGGGLVLAALGFTVSYLSNRGRGRAQADEFERLRTALAPAAARQAPFEPSDLEVALDAVTEVDNARVRAARRLRPRRRPLRRAADRRRRRRLPTPARFATFSSRAWWRCSRSTMWRQIRDPEYLLGALKTYRMMTGLSQVDPGFAQGLVDRAAAGVRHHPALPDRGRAHLPARRHRAHRPTMTASFRPTTPSSQAALQSICSIPLAKRAYDALRSDPAATALPDWIPAAVAGPNAAKVFVRRSEKTLRVGIDGLYTYKGFHDVVLERLRGRRRPGGARPFGLRWRLPGERRRLGLGPRRRHAQALLRGLHRPVGRLPPRHHAGAAHRPAHRHREPQGSSRAPIPR